MMREMRYLDKLVDELAKGKPWRKFCEEEGFAEYKKQTRMLLPIKK